MDCCLHAESQAVLVVLLQHVGMFVSELLSCFTHIQYSACPLAMPSLDNKVNMSCACQSLIGICTASIVMTAAF